MTMPPSSVRRRPSTISMIFSSETKRQIKVKLLASEEGGTKVCINDPGHMTKMAAIAINSKNLLKQFLPRSRGPMILKLSLKHQAIEFYKVGIHHNAGMTLTYFMARST